MAQLSLESCTAVWVSGCSVRGVVATSSYCYFCNDIDGGGLASSAVAMPAALGVSENRGP